MAYSGQNPREINPIEFSEQDRKLSHGMLANARNGQPVSATGVLRLNSLAENGSSVQAVYFLKEIGSVVGAELAIDLPRGASGLVDRTGYDYAVGTLWKWQGIANS